tara:strand:+ start:59 stop:667 length:609 start_codon:yes stop_codon:yes gene_type:complete
MDFLKRIVKGLQQKGYRAGVLSEAARETGPSGGGIFGIPGTENAPEFGVGETVRGWLGQDRHELDRNNPEFTQNMIKALDRRDEQGVNNPFKGVIGANEATGELYRLPDTKQESTGNYEDKTPSNTQQQVELTQDQVEKGQKAVALAEARKQWLHDTRNSPAATSMTHGKPTWTDEERWQQHLNHQKWKKEQGRNYTHGDFF